MKYIINDIHEFEMSITAKSIPVNVDVDTNALKFTFD